MSSPTAFQPSAFQNDAFQIGVPVGVGGQDNPSYEDRFLTDLISGNRRMATAAYADDHPSDGGPTTGPARSTKPSSGNRRSGTGGSSRPRRSDGWRRQPPG
jgi:hypothetical protein